MTVPFSPSLRRHAAVVIRRYGVLALLCAAACSRGEARPLPEPSTPKDRFWAAIERARGSWGSCERIADRLTDDLATRPAKEIVEFDREFDRRMVESYRWDLWAVAYVANEGESDDGFDYFRAWLIDQGRERFEAALRDPPAAVAGASRVGELECEPLLYSASEAYKRVTGQELPPSGVVWPKEPAGKPWTEDTIDQVYPGLTARVRARQ